MRWIPAVLLAASAARAASYPGPADVEARLRRLAASPDGRARGARIVEIGRSHEGRPILALALGSSPARVLFVGLHHGRERLSADLVLRLAEHLVAARDPRTSRLVAQREAWLVPVVNPDGYQRTFEPGARDWRKNARDNDGDGRVGPGDGVDLNRNYDWRWADAPRASPDPISPEYRGPAPFSEPETRAIRDLLASRRFAFAVAYHAYGSYLVYPEAAGAVGREPPDVPIFRTLAGDRRRPAIRSSLRVGREGAEPYRVVHGNPDIGGRFDAWAYHQAGVLAFYVELHDGYGFDFPEEEAARARVLTDNLPFALDLLESSAHPARPVSHLGRQAPPLRHDPPRRSRGDRPLLEVLARRDLGAPLLFYAGPGGSGLTPMAPIESGVYYARYAAPVHHPGGDLRYFFVAGAKRLPEGDPFVLRREGPGGDLLVLTRKPERWGPLLRAAKISVALWPRDDPPDAGAVLAAFRRVLWDVPDPDPPRTGPILREIAEYVARGGSATLVGASGLALARRPPPASLRAAPGVPRPRALAQSRIDYVPGDAESHAYVPRTLRALAGIDAVAALRARRRRVFVGGRALRLANLAASPRRLIAPGGNVLATLRPRLPFGCDGRCWLSGSADDTLARLARRLDLRRARRATFVVRARWNLEAHNDYFFVAARRPGGPWRVLPDLDRRTVRTFGPPGDRRQAWRNAWARARALDLRRGGWHAVTGSGQGILRFDLSPFAGAEIEVSLGYLADPHRHGPGVAVFEVTLPELGIRLDARDPGWAATSAFGKGRWRAGSDPALRPAVAVRRERVTVSGVHPADLEPEDALRYLRVLLGPAGEAHPGPASSAR